MTEINHLPNVGIFSFEDCLYTAIRKVPNPTSNAQTPCFRSRFRAIEYPLDLACDYDVSSDLHEVSLLQHARGFRLHFSLAFNSDGSLGIYPKPKAPMYTIAEEGS
jgi:hypothetical protein